MPSRSRGPLQHLDREAGQVGGAAAGEGEVAAGARHVARARSRSLAGQVRAGRRSGRACPSAARPGRSRGRCRRGRCAQPLVEHQDGGLGEEQGVAVGLARATAWAARLPLAAGRLSTTTGWRQRAARASPMRRAATSGAPPGGAPTRRRTGREGKAPWAAAPRARAGSAGRRCREEAAPRRGEGHVRSSSIACRLSGGVGRGERPAAVRSDGLGLASTRAPRQATNPSGRMRASGAS